MSMEIAADLTSALRGQVEKRQARPRQKGWANSMKYLLKNIFLPLDADFSDIAKTLESLVGVSGVIDTAYF